MEKQRRIKMLSLSAVIIAVLGLTVAFAALSTTLNIKGSAYLDAAKWGIKFQNLSEPSIVGEASDAKTAKIEKYVSINDIKVTLSKPGDSVTYTVDLVNDGDINAKIENIEKTNLTEEQQKYITFTVKYKENDTELKIGDILSKKEVKPLVIKIEYRKDLESSDLPKSAQGINLSYKLDFVQTDDKAVTTKNLKSTIVNGTKGSGTFLNGNITKDSVESISFLSNNEVPTDVIGSWDASQEKDKTVMAWYIDNDKNGLYEVYIGGQGKVIAPENMSYFFDSFSKLQTLDLNFLDTSNVTNMTAMFQNCSLLKTLDLSGLNTKNVTIMTGLFNKCSSLANINLSSFNTKNVTNMNAMFSQCTSLESLNVSSFNTSNVENIQSLFYHCTSLINLDLSNWNVSKVTSLYSTFDMCSSLKSLNLNNWNTTKITSIRTAFYGCSSLSELDLSSFDFSNVTDYTENSFYNVTVPIYVKNDKSKEFLLSKNSSLIVIVK